jgi:hypothetical protein
MRLMRRHNRRQQEDGSALILRLEILVPAVGSEQFEDSVVTVEAQ